MEPIRRGQDPQILIGGHPLNGRLMGVEYMVTEVEGWLDTPDVKQDSVSRERADGDFPAPWNYESRLIEINGYAFCQSKAQRQHVRDQLAGIGAAGREWLTIQGPGPTQSALVGRSARHRFFLEGDDRLRFELRLKADDPRKTGQLYRKTINATQTTHSQLGNYPASPTIRVFPSNTPGGFVVNAFYDGQVRRWEYAAGGWSNQEHVIELETGKHFVNGVEVPDRLGPAQLWSIPPRTQVAVRLFPNVSTERLQGEITYRDTYI